MALAGCVAPPTGDSADAGVAPTMALSDISGESPDLAASPFGGQPGWDHTDKYAPGVALIDLDGDGALDLVQPRNDRADPALRSLRMYRGLGDGRFEDVTPVAWDTARNATVALAFDYDGDGDLDVFIGVDGGPSALYRNDGDWRFTEVAAKAGADAPGARVLTAAAGDIDGDGDLDLYLGTWNADAPGHGDGTADNLLLRNDGGAFTDVTAAAGVACHGWSTLGLAFADLDGDGDQDLMVANDFFPACLFENRGDGTFDEVAEAAGVSGGAFNGMGVAVGDLDGDLDLDIMVTDDEVADDSRGNAVYLNRGGPGLAFDSAAIELGLDGVQTLGVDWLVCWGVGLVDLDLDGDLDVHVATHGQRSELVWRNDAGTFTPERALMAALADMDARGTAYGDLDGDGDLDAVVARRGAGLQILRNDTAGGAALTVAPRPLAAAPGALVRVTVAGRTQLGVVQAGSSYLSTSPPSVTFGLGAADRADRVEVVFPDGTVRTAADVPAGRVELAR
jgi:hypothetical protein